MDALIPVIVAGSGKARQGEVRLYRVRSGKAGHDLEQFGVARTICSDQGLDWRGQAW